MKRSLIWLSSLVASLFMLSACVEVVPQNTVAETPNIGDYEYTYTLHRVLEIDPLNTTGIDLLPHLDWFKSFSVKVYVEDGQYVACEIDNGGVPFSPYTFPIPSGKVQCSLDTDHLPWTLRLSTGEAVATYKQGQFCIPFQLDCADIRYEYWFK